MAGDKPQKGIRNKVNYNPKSRNNLTQYTRPKTEAEKKKLLKSIAAEAEIDLELLEVIVPTKKVFTDEEQKRFLKLVKLHLTELTEQGAKVTTQDMQALASLCKNLVMEDRLLEDAKTKFKQDPTAIVNVMAAVDKLKKANEKLSESLATNRNIRVDPKRGSNITILDILEAYESETFGSAEERLAVLEAEEEELAGEDKYVTTIDDMIR